VGIGRIGKVLNHDIKALINLITETYKGFNQKGILYNSSGEDSPPIKDDKVFLVKADGTGQYIIVGVLTQSQGANPGEKIFFARDGDGNITLKIKLLNDGSYILDTITETTQEATGDYTRKIKGGTNIFEEKDRIYINNSNIDETIKKNRTLKINGDYTIIVDGNINITALKNIKFKAARIDLN
jgi:hypothetical protein